MESGDDGGLCMIDGSVKKNAQRWLQISGIFVDDESGLLSRGWKKQVSDRFGVSIAVIERMENERCLLLNRFLL